MTAQVKGNIGRVPIGETAGSHAGNRRDPAGRQRGRHEACTRSASDHPPGRPADRPVSGAVSAPASRTPSRTFRSLANVNFRKFFIGQGLSQIGTWMQMVAAGILVLRITNSGVALGLMAAAQFGPTLAFGAWAGVSPTASTAITCCWASTPWAPWWARPSPWSWRPASTRSG